jgi:nitric oxide reductase activation protein
MTFRNAQQSVENNRVHFRGAIEQIAAAGVPEFPQKGNYPATTPKESAAKQAADLKDYVKQARAALREDNKETAEKLKEYAAAQIEHIDKTIERLQEKEKELRAVSEKLIAVGAKYKSAAEPAGHVVAMLNAVNEKLRQLAQMKAQTETAINALAGNSGTSKSVADAGSVIHRCARERPDGGNSLLQEAVWSTGPSMQRFIHSATCHHTDMKTTGDGKVSDWHQPAISRFLEELTHGPAKADFSNHAIKAANEELFKALRALFYDKDGGYADIPESMRGVSDENKGKLESAAESLGVPAKKLLQMLREISNDENAGKSNADADELGCMIKERLAPMAKENSPIDDGLFGELVEKASTVLDGTALTQINDEARNAAEEEYVAYLNHTEAKPTVKVKKTTKKDAIGGQAVVTRVIGQNRSAISRIREALQFQSTKRTGEVYGLRDGDLDEGSLHKLRYDSEHIWSQKTVSQLPDVAVGILVDQSGSMSSGHKIDQARDMCIILSEAVRKVSGVHLHIYGHTANQHGNADLTLFEHHSSVLGAENADLGALGNIRAYSNNYDGYAIKETAKLLDQDPAKRKYLFVIADGLPHGQGYSGDEAEKHVTSVCSFVRTRLKIPTYAFAVGVPTYERDSFESQYGKNNVLFLSRVQQCLPQITRFLRNALQREKTLVDVSAD